MQQCSVVRVVVQRVLMASVTVDETVVGSIGNGLCLLVGVAEGDDVTDVTAAVDKIVGLRIFADEEGKMNRSLLDVGGEALVVSQFTLLGDVRRGRRPSFTASARPDVAEPLVDRMVGMFSERGVTTASGEFGAKMSVRIENDGPVTLVIDVRQGAVS
jgi:D-tyrosyl-tRNA(Tyr) deacylase